MTNAAKAKTYPTPAARQKRVWDKAAPGYDRQIAFFERSWFSGGREWLGERITIRTAGEHFTRQLPLVTAAGFQVMETERLKAGTVERIHAVKPV